MFFVTPYILLGFHWVNPCSVWCSCWCFVCSGWMKTTVDPTHLVSLCCHWQSQRFDRETMRRVMKYTLLALVAHRLKCTNLSCRWKWWKWCEFTLWENNLAGTHWGKMDYIDIISFQQSGKKMIFVGVWMQWESVHWHFLFNKSSHPTEKSSSYNWDCFVFFFLKDDTDKAVMRKVCCWDIMATPEHQVPTGHIFTKSVAHLRG